MPDMTKSELNKIVAYYLENKDPETAKNYINSFGPRIKNYDAAKELERIDKLNKPEKEG